MKTQYIFFSLYISLQFIIWFEFMLILTFFCQIHDKNALQFFFLLWKYGNHLSAYKTKIDVTNKHNIKFPTEI